MITGDGFGNWALTQVAFCLNQGGDYIGLIWLSMRVEGNDGGVQQQMSGFLSVSKRRLLKQLRRAPDVAPLAIHYLRRRVRATYSIINRNQHLPMISYNGGGGTLG